MHQLDKLKAQHKEIYTFARKHKVKKFYVFGSCARRKETTKSDIDFLVKFNPDTFLLDLIELEDELRSFFRGKPCQSGEVRAEKKNRASPMPLT